VADPKEQKSDSDGAGASAGSNKVMMGLLGLNMVVMVAVALVLFLGQKKQASQQTLDQVAAGAAAEQAAGHAPAAAGGHGEASPEGAAVSQARFFPVGDFTANLAGPASTSYVKVTVNFEISTDADEEEMKQRKPQFRDKIISLLNSKKSVDLQSADGRNYLKEEIKTVANTFIKKGKVEGVYFSAFVIN
jgi:flagellar basal body-associated protein FliL